ncbi:MAG TPA: hypothetical protein VK254_03565 [Candidatus Bathyarchaeia archaeon]|nr:hypothetical protein [Candidatus Bathyarchaeia archaeon]
MKNFSDRKTLGGMATYVVTRAILQISTAICTKRMRKEKIPIAFANVIPLDPRRRKIRHKSRARTNFEGG